MLVFSSGFMVCPTDWTERFQDRVSGKPPQNHLKSGTKRKALSAAEPQAPRGHQAQPRRTPGSQARQTC